MGKDSLFVNEVWEREADILGLGDQEMIIPTEQVKIVVGLDKFTGSGRILINVHDVEITEMDHINQMVNYRITGLTQLTQNWDLGGSYLSPSPIETSSPDIDYA